MPASEFTLEDWHVCESNLCLHFAFVAGRGAFRRSVQAAPGAFSLPPSMTRIGLRIRRSWRRRTGAAGVPRQEIIQVAPASLRVAVQGAGQPLLLLAGLGGGLDMWGPFQRHLAGFEVISFDPPGTGGSGPVRFPLGMAEMARLAAGVVEVLGRQPVDVLGYSWGGALAQEFAHRFPHLVRRLVLCSSTCGLGGVPGSLEALAALVIPWRPSSPAYLEHVTPRLFGGVAGREPGRFFGADEPARSPQAPSLVGYAAQLYAIASWTSLPWLHRLGPPTLVVAGDDDPVVPLANARLLANRIPDCRLHVVAGGGHLILLDQPEVVAPVVREFLLDLDTLAAQRGRAAWEQLTARCR